MSHCATVRCTHAHLRHFPSQVCGTPLQLMQGALCCCCYGGGGVLHSSLISSALLSAGMTGMPHSLRMLPQASGKRPKVEGNKNDIFGESTGERFAAAQLILPVPRQRHARVWSTASALLDQPRPPRPASAS
jgi:hypothetical protein